MLYRFEYPTERHQIPDWVMKKLIARLATDQEDDLSKGKTCSARWCRGSSICRTSIARDSDDGRLVEGVMTPTEIAAWTAAIDRRGPEFFVDEGAG